jgi:hypothetical protein
LSVEKSDRISQSKSDGTRIYVDSYKVKYQFQFQGRDFENVDIIPVTLKNKQLLADILERDAIDICTVKFDLDNPVKSLLIESE